jgi:hypothetical protein
MYTIGAYVSSSITPIKQNPLILLLKVSWQQLLSQNLSSMH